LNEPSNNPDESDMVRKKTSYYIDEDLHREFVIYCATYKGNRAMSETLEDAIREYMKNHPKAKTD